MCFSNDLEDQVAIVRMNAELRGAQVELLSAQCATDRLRLKFSTEQIARHAHQDVLRKAIKTSASLHDYYSSIERHRARSSVASEAAGVEFGEKLTLEAITRVADYLQQQRDFYLPQSSPLSGRYTASMEGFFAPALLDGIRVLELKGQRVSNPPFYQEAMAMGLANLPDLVHTSSLTFVDVLVFNDRITERALFHGLVHALQFQMLGLERYTELFVRAFFRTQSRLAVPLEAHVFLLESKFMEDRTKTFSVEEQVRLWVDQRHY